MGPKRNDVTRQPPQNAWILIGDAAAYPSREDLAAMRTNARRGHSETLWTAPMNGSRGDLVLFYFTAPRKAAAFVARLASDPFWDAEIDVNAETTVDSHQWWAYTTQLIEIEPIPFKQLNAAHNGSLILKGRSGKYVTPLHLSSLEFSATIRRDRAELRNVVQIPTGLAELPDPTTIELEAWRSIASGTLRLEALVSRYVVEPLFRYLGEAWEWAAFRPTLKPQYRVSAGFVDYVVTGAEPLLAVEVKLAIRRPQGDDWMTSPDFRQLRRYMDELDVPGILVDSNSVILVNPGGDKPDTEFSRAEATSKDLEGIASLMYLAMNEKYGGTGAALANAAGDRRRDLQTFWAFLPGSASPVVAIRAPSRNSPAVDAVPVVDIPAFRDLASRFLTDESCERVASEYLGGNLLDDHAYATVIGAINFNDRPEATEELMKLIGPNWNALLPLQAKRKALAAARRVARRG
jgi:hypothetical protein